MNTILRVPATALAALLFLLTCHTQSAVAADPEVHLIPWPQSLTVTGGEMALTASSRVVYSDEILADLAQVVAGEVEEVTRLKLATVQGEPVGGDICLKLSPDGGVTGEAYQVTVAAHATAEGANYNAVAMATVTLIQALRDYGGHFSIPKMTVQDAPDAGYRGFMVDVARQRHSIKTLKEMVDMCRLYKIRFMQIHFNDDQAYTLPSTAYPELNAASPYTYTWAEVTDLVDYADDRGVILIPEIEVPAHASAMINGNPELFGGAGGVINFASTEVWDALATIINEACDIFQSAPYIHLGADEANLNGLDQQQDYIDAIARYEVGDIHGLFNYFISHLDDEIKERGKKTVVWEGFSYWLTGNAKMDPDVHVMMFDNAKSPQAYLDAGHKVINASWNPMYIVGFDGQGWGMPADWIFQWDKSQFHGMLNYPKTAERTKLNPLVPSDQVVGAQMCSWEMMEWRQIPRLRFRIAPFAERIWNPGSTHDFAHFEKRYQSTDVLLDLVLAEHRPPDAPADVGASDGFYADKIRVGWRDGGNYPRGFALYKNTENDPATATLVSDRFPKTTTFYEDTDVPAGQTCYYWVKAKNNWGWSEFREVASGRTGVRQAVGAYEPFDYPAGVNIEGQNGGTGFSSAWEKLRDSGPLTVVADSLSYPGLPTEGGALFVDHTINEAVDLSRHVTEEVGEDMTELWVSFLVKGDPVKSGWMTADLNNGRRFGKESVNGIGIHYATTVFMESKVTYLFVLHVDYRPGHDNMYMWVNPSTEQQLSLDEYDSIWETSDEPKGKRFKFNLSGTEFGKYLIDEVRVGTTWEEVIGVSNLDPDAPTPNPMTWKAEPAAQGTTAAIMEANAARHPDGVEYYFEETSGNPGGDDSGWQTGTAYTDTGLQAGRTYTYRVKTRSGGNESHWSVPALMVLPGTAIGVNLASDRGPSSMAGERFDSVSHWTDATGPKGSGLAVLGTGGMVTCAWTANSLWGWGSVATPEDKLYHGLLDDVGNDSATVTFTGLQAWLKTVGCRSYTVRVYRNTDSVQSFSDVDLRSGESVIGVIPFPDRIRDLTGPGMRARGDSKPLTADTITIDPQPSVWGKARATLSGVRIMANP